MKSLLGKASVLLVLAAFVVAKAAFWLALLPGYPSHPVLDSPPVSAETSHPCACTGAAVCQCGPGGCCEPESTPQIVQNDNGPHIHSPNLCGRLSQGAGPAGEMPAVTLPLQVCQLLQMGSQPLCPGVVDILSGRTDRPVAPPPKA